MLNVATSLDLRLAYSALGEGSILSYKFGNPNN